MPKKPLEYKRAITKVKPHWSETISGLSPELKEQILAHSKQFLKTSGLGKKIELIMLLNRIKEKRYTKQGIDKLFQSATIDLDATLRAMNIINDYITAKPKIAIRIIEYEKQHGPIETLNFLETTIGKAERIRQETLNLARRSQPPMETEHDFNSSL